MDIVGSSWADRPVKITVENGPLALEMRFYVVLVACLGSSEREALTRGEIGDIRFEGDLLVSCHLEIGSLEAVGEYDASLLYDDERQALWTYELHAFHAVLYVVEGDRIFRREDLRLTLAHWSRLVELINSCGARHDAARSALEITDRAFGKILDRR